MSAPEPQSKKASSRPVKGPSEAADQARSTAASAQPVEPQETLELDPRHTGSTAASDVVATGLADQVITGVLRDCTPQGRGRKRLKPGEIAVIDASDITRREAQWLIDHKPAAVINIAEFSTGALPNVGPIELLDAGIVLVGGVGPEIRGLFRDGARKGRIEADGTVLNGTKTIAQGTRLNLRDADTGFTDAQRSLVDNMEAYFGNTIEFIHSEAPLLIDGLGVPDLGSELTNRKVLVVAPGEHHEAQIQQLRNFIREYDPYIIGVDSAADTLQRGDYHPHLIVGDPTDIASETLRGGARVILPAEPDGHAPGLQRIQDLGVGAMTFPAASESATDLALLLADYHGAQMIVLAGDTMDLQDVFTQRANATPAALVTRAQLGGRLVDADRIIDLYNLGSGRGMAWLWALLGLLVAVAAIILVVGLGGDDTFVNNLIDTWNGIALTVQGWFS